MNIASLLVCHMFAGSDVFGTGEATDDNEGFGRLHTEQVSLLSHSQLQQPFFVPGHGDHCKC